MKLESSDMKEFKADMHIHTCLSPCADLEMSPRNIIKEAKKKGLDIIGICDHNSAENFPAMEKSANIEGIKAIGGIEITSREEVDLIHKFNGIAIASHIDREGFSIIANLGFIPEGLKLDALEIIEPSKRDKINTGKDFVFITSSDAHLINDIGKRYSCFLMKESTFEEIRKCLRRENGREATI